MLGSYGEAAGFMEEEGSYKEEDIQNLYKVTLIIPTPVAKTESKKASNQKPVGLIPDAPKRPGGTLSG